MRVAIIGAGVRCRNLYIPTLRAIPQIGSIGIWSRGEVQIDSPITFKYSSFEHLLSDRSVELLIACVGWTENGKLYRQLASYPGPILLETPLGVDRDEATAVAHVLSARTQLTVIAEQYHLRPIEVLKRELLRKGVFGDLLHAFNDGVGHEYHGVSLIRAIVGTERKLIRAQAVRREFPCHPHRDHATRFARGELVEHALLEFEGGLLASYHWSWLSYMSPIRSRRATGFHGTLGAAWGEEMIHYSDTTTPAEPLFVERRTRVVGGLEVLTEIVVWKRDQVLARWQNPVAGLGLDEERSTTAALLLSMLDATNRDRQAFYSVSDALRDHEIVDAIRQASGH